MSIGGTEIILIVAAVILVFGATQIPKIARALGEGLKEFKKAAKESKESGGENDSPKTKPRRKK
jgi:sec-independent protein translocase protein TatA